VAKGFRDGDVLVYCERLYPAQRIPFLVKDCSGYSNRMVPHRYDLEQMAWKIETKKIERHTGFVKPTRDVVRLNEPNRDDEQ